MDNKKNILFIGPYRSSSGWGLAAKDYIHALAKTGHNLSIKPVYMCNSICDIDYKLVNYEVNKLDKVDIVIQNVLPPLMEYIEGAYNIGLLFVESNHLEHTGWIERINLMDEVWVASTQEKSNLVDSGVNIPINVVPMPINTEKFKAEGQPLQLKELDSSYVFYFIGEYISRKNVDKLVLSFHREFRNNESVSLILKVSKSGMHPQQLAELIRKDLTELKEKMRLYYNSNLYSPEFIVTDRLNEEELLGLHQRGDCIVIPSSGESLSRPVMEAMSVGNTAIVTDHTGMRDLLNCGVYLIDSIETPCLVSDPPTPYLYTSNETWFTPDIISLQKQMRRAYNDRDKDNTNKQFIQQYGYASIAERMKEVL